MSTWKSFLQKIPTEREEWVDFTDPNIWFDNVEIIAAKEIGSETVSYVANIVKYFVVYRLSLVRALQRLEARESMEAQ